MTNKAYIGDGVYAEFENGMIKLFCESPSQENTIYLEDTVLQNLLRFAEDCFGVNIKVEYRTDRELIK